jgi:pimeloyl-ACP methyl ester carboxylesterase
VDEGFADSLAAAGLAIDMVAVDAHMGYYQNRSVLERLREDVILPAREAGYEQIWLTGISMGGTGAILYQERYGADVAGVLLLAPFLGRDGVIQEIQQAGGAASWEPDQALAEEDFERGMWAWLKTAVGVENRPIYLGYGTRDKLAEGHQLLAGILPPEQVLTRPGGHDWQTWSLLWQDFLAAGALADCVAQEQAP